MLQSTSSPEGKPFTARGRSIREKAGKLRKAQGGEGTLGLSWEMPGLPSPTELTFRAAQAGGRDDSPHQPQRVKCSYFQQLLYQRSPVAFDMAESMMPEDIQSGAAELRKERKRLLRSSAPAPTQLFMSYPADHSWERRRGNGQHPFRREIKPKRV